jgi:pimeloyl-ACP methyl ester carboxylesterase
MTEFRISLGHLLPIVALFVQTGCHASAPGFPVILPDGRRMLFHCEGKGAPTVVLESAYATPWMAWDNISSAISRRTRVCGYNRAGLTGSDPARLPRDGDAIATDLDAGLRAARIKPPYLLVAHSIGGLYARIFYARHSRSVVGMVLVDPSVEHQEQRFAQALPGSGGSSLEPVLAPARECVRSGRAVLSGLPATIPTHCGNDPKQVVAVWSDMASELENMGGSTSAQIDEGPKSYGSLPLIVLTAGKTYYPPFEQVWKALHDEIAQRSSRGQSLIISNSGHNMLHDAPGAVVSAVDDVLDMVNNPDMAQIAK